MDDKQVQFLPFNAINEFMLPDFRLQVLQTVFTGLDKLPNDRKSAINNVVKRHVQVQGFRNSLLAPARVKARNSVTIFERNKDFAGHVLQGWSELHAELAQKVYDFLKTREWEVLPPDTDRTKVPGFLVVWPEGQDYDVLGKAYTDMYPDDKPEDNDLRLMIVWIAGRLPYGMYGDEDEEELEGEEE